MHFTVLLENESDRAELRSEHGISIWVETERTRILFDTGASDAFAANADRLGVSIADADALVLSHAHADHTGGLTTFFARNHAAPVYVGPDITRPRFSIKGGNRRAIGIDRAVYDAHADRFRDVDGTVELAAGVGVSTVATRGYPPPSGNRSLLREKGDGLEPDPFEEEIFLWVRDPDGVHVVTGCSHSGIVNIVEAARAHGTVVSVVGGFHLKGESEERIRDIAKHLSELRELYTGHCTGRPAYDVLRDELGEKVRYAATGIGASA